MKATRNYIFLFCAICALALSSCRKEGVNAGRDGYKGVKTISFRVGGGTKVTINGLKTLWEEDDKVAVWDGVVLREFHVVEGSIEEGRQYCTIEGEASWRGEGYTAIYPYSNKITCDEDGTFHFEIPSVQEIPSEEPKRTANHDAFVSISSDPAYPIGYSNNPKGFEFKNVVAPVKVEVPSGGAKLVQICAIDATGETVALSGAFKGSTAEGVTVDTVDDTKQQYNYVNLASEGTIEQSVVGTTLAEGNYYVALAPSIAKNGIRVIYVDENGNSKVKEITASRTFTRNEAKFNIPLSSDWISASVIYDSATLQSYLSNESKPSIAYLLSDIYKKPDGTKADGDKTYSLDLRASLPSGKTLDGQGHAIHYWKQTDGKAIFKNIESEAKVKNLIFASDCEYTPVPGTKDETCYTCSMLAGTCFGTIENCHNKAAMSVDDSDTGSGGTKQYRIGALVSEIYKGAVIKNCSNSGNIEVKMKYFGCPQLVGGIVCAVYGNSASDKSGDDDLSSVNRIENCINYGSITLDATPPYNYSKSHFLGGIAAQSYVNTGGYSKNYGTISGCSNKGAIYMNGNEGYTGGYAFLGGIIGYMEGKVENCTNYSDGTVTLFFDNFEETDSKENQSTSSPRVGGIAGACSEGASGCTNYAPVTVTGCFGNAGGGYNAGILGFVATSIGGCFGLMGKDGTYVPSGSMTGCTNEGDVTLTLKMPKQNYSGHNLGGVAGTCSYNLSNCHNKGKLIVKDYVYGIRTGGVVGRNFGQAASCTNTGDLTFTTNSYAGYCDVGGLFGSFEGGGRTATSCVNSGSVKVTYNSLKDDVAPDGPTAVNSYSCLIGGITGESSNVTYRSGNENSGTIAFDSDEYNAPLLVGGCTAYLVKGGEINDFKNSGPVHIYAKNYLSTSIAGGVVGYVDSAPISYCNNNAEVIIGKENSEDGPGHCGPAWWGIGQFAVPRNSGETNAQLKNRILNNTGSASKYLQVGAAGGIVGVGYAELITGKVTPAVSLTGCNNTGDVKLSLHHSSYKGYLGNNRLYVGGIAGEFKGHIDNCTNGNDKFSSIVSARVSGDINKSGATIYEGGIVGGNYQLDFGNNDNLQVTGCTNRANVTLYSTNANGTYNDVGGIVGKANEEDGARIDKISNCVNGDADNIDRITVSSGGTCTVRTGGISGTATNLEKCVNYGKVVMGKEGGPNPGIESATGGIMGFNSRGFLLQYCINYGSVYCYQIGMKGGTGGMVGNIGDMSCASGRIKGGGVKCDVYVKDTDSSASTHPWGMICGEMGTSKTVYIGIESNTGSEQLRVSTGSTLTLEFGTGSSSKTTMSSTTDRDAWAIKHRNYSSDIHKLKLYSDDPVPSN